MKLGNKKMVNISILGCGWLGLPLAKLLLNKGYMVKGSTTRSERLQELHSEGIEPFKISVTSEGIDGEISSFIKGSDIVIIDFPPGLRKNPDADYTGAIRLLLAEVEKIPGIEVLFISSISVFKEQDDFPKYSESSTPNAASAAAKQLINVEELILKNKNLKSNILRLGGLIGGERHPINQLSGRKALKNPAAPVNLVHRDDCKEMILRIIERESFGEIFHAVYPFHPEKEKYYSKLAADRNLPAPQFKIDGVSKGKFIMTSSTEKKLDFSFINPV